MAIDLIPTTPINPNQSNPIIHTNTQVFFLKNLIRKKYILILLFKIPAAYAIIEVCLIFKIIARLPQKLANDFFFYINMLI